MKFTLQATRIIMLSAFLGLCLLSSQYAFSQKTYTIPAGGDWATAANWSGGTLPTSTDSVIIAAGQDIQIMADTARCRKLNIIGDGTNQGKVTVSTGAVLLVNADNAAVSAGPTNAALILLGGMLENNGVTTVTGRQSLDAIRFDNPTSGTLSSTYMGSGTLNCGTSSSTGGGGSANTGACITFAQTSGTATFTLSSTGVYNFSTQVATTNGTKSAIYCPKGNANINGTGTMTISGARRSIRIVPAAGETAHLTIETGATLNLSSSITTTTLIGVIILDNSVANVSANMTNKGTINISGTGLNGIYMNNAAAATTTTNFTNEGTININGAFTEASSAGAIYLAGGANTFGDVFTNSGTINFNTTSGGTSTKPLFFCSTTPKSLITNSGTITVGTNAPTPPAIAFRLGDSKTIVDNSGTITVGAGSISGVTANAVFNNKTNGILNLNSGISSSLVAFSNVGGTFNVNASQRVGRLTINNGAVTVADGTTFTVFLLTLTSGHITLGTGNVEIENPGGSIVGGSLSSHIITSGTGKLTQPHTAGLSKTYPIGQSASSYDPVTITPASAVTFGARVGVQSTTIAAGNAALVVDREWNITVSATPGETSLAFTSSANNIDGSSTRPSGSAGVIGHYNGTSWEDISAAYSTDTWTVTGYTGSFSPFIVAAPGVALPTELKAFKATPLSNKNLLTWETATEINNKGFDIQRKTINGTWESLGFVNGIGKATTYNFTDNTPLSISYYRLRQVDFDNTESLSKVVSVRQNIKGQMRVSPNPVSDRINITFFDNEQLENATITLYDLLGKQVLIQKIITNTLELDMSDLTKGTYILKINTANDTYTEKIIKQ